jgi:hypothetical protein
MRRVGHSPNKLENGDEMRERLMKIAERLREYDVTGRVLATILVGSSHQTIWPIYLWLRGAWDRFGFPPVCAWIASAAYFGLCVWLVALLARNWKQYPGMILDAIFGGSLLTVAVALEQPPVRMALSQTGLGAAAWVVLLSGSALVIGRSVQPHEAQSKQP